ncbi:MAG: RagB/SusD family nutrient uptake outer membrane protein [Saprospiraceae bacterium]
MKSLNIKGTIFGCILALSLIAFITSCKIDDLNNPNGASLEEVVADATVSDLNSLVSGTEALMRFDVGFYYDAVGIVGREYWRFTGSDPRYTADLLGAAPLDNNTFYTTRSFAGRYRAIRSTNILLDAVQNTKADLTDAQKNGYRGFAKTIQAYQLLLVLNQQYQNGVRVDVKDPDKLGSFVSYDESLKFISDLLTEASGNLSTAGESFAFTLSSGFSGFSTPGDFNLFNQALLARVELYRGNYAASEAALNKSFVDVDADLEKGVYMFFSTAGGDEANPISYPPGTKDGLVAHPSFIDSLEANDDRAAKVLKRDPITLDSLTGEYDVVTYPTKSSNVPIIKNEELILIDAEIKVQNQAFGDAVALINAVRNGHGLIDYQGPATTDALINEILKQRFLSLYQEGHRWVDMRRLGKLSELPLDRPGDQVWEQFPRPLTEN